MANDAYQQTRAMVFCNFSAQRSHQALDCVLRSTRLFPFCVRSRRSSRSAATTLYPYSEHAGEQQWARRRVQPESVGWTVKSCVDSY